MVDAGDEPVLGSFRAVAVSACTAESFFPVSESEWPLSEGTFCASHEGKETGSEAWSTMQVNESGFA